MAGMDTNRACQRLFFPILPLRQCGMGFWFWFETVWNQAVGTSLEPSVRLLGTSAVLVFRYDFERQDFVKWYYWDTRNQNNLSITIATVRTCRPPGMGLVAAQMWSWIGNLLSGLVNQLQISSLATLPRFRFIVIYSFVVLLWAHLHNLEAFIDFMACCLHPHEFDSNSLQRWERREQQRRASSLGSGCKLLSRIYVWNTSCTILQPNADTILRQHQNKVVMALSM